MLKKNKWCLIWCTDRSSGDFLRWWGHGYHDEQRTVKIYQISERDSLSSAPGKIQSPSTSSNIFDFRCMIDRSGGDRQTLFLSRHERSMVTLPDWP